MAIWNHNDEWILGPMEDAYTNIYKENSILVDQHYEGKGLLDDMSSKQIT